MFVNKKHQKNEILQGLSVIKQVTPITIQNLIADNVNNGHL